MLAVLIAERFLRKMPIKKLTTFVVSVGGVGFLPFMPGTWGSLVSIPLGAYLISCGSAVFFSVFFAIALGGWFFAKLYLEQNPEKSDPSEVVIDEVVGQLLALSPLLGSTFFVSSFDYWFVVVAFISFRIFDIFKPWPVSWADQLEGGPAKSALGIILDDIFAGGYGALTLIATILLVLRFDFIK